MTAKDKGTNKEQKIRIESSSGLSKDEVEKMRRDAEAHAGEDKERRALVELKNQADQQLYEIDKQLAEHGAKLESADKQAIESAKEGLKQASQGEDRARLEAALRDFQTKAQKLGEVLYKQGTTPPPAGAPEPTAKAAAGAQGGDEPVDADFEVKA